MSERYNILQLIRKDSVGGLYLAEDETLGRKVAFRNFEQVSGESVLTKPNTEFSEFAGKLTALQHPNLLTIYDIAFDDGEAYMVTQHMEDESLSDRLEKGPVPQDRVYQMAKDVLEGLHAAHASGIYHGALNTQSVHRVPVASGGHRYMVVDLGLNQLALIIRGDAGDIVDPILMAPELHGGSEVDAKVDLFMLGQLCYTALAGGHPFAEMDVEECAQRYRENALPDIEEFAPGVQKDFMDWILLLARGDAAERPEDVKEAMKLLQEVPLSDPTPVTSAQAGVKLVAPAQAATSTSAMIQAAPATTATQAMPTAAQVTQTQQQGAFEVQPSCKKPLVIIGVLSVLILGVVAFMVFRGDSSDSGETSAEKNHSGLAAAPEDAVVHLHSADPMGDETIDLEVSGLLDWSVTTGVPISSSRERMKDGKFISNVLQAGEFKEVVNDKYVAEFKAGDKSLTAKGMSGNGNELAVGEGWEVYLRIPKNHEGPILVRFYMTHENVPISIEATAPRESDPIKHLAEANDKGKSVVLLELTKPQPSGFYTFKLLAGSPQDGDSIKMALHAIQVSEK